MIDTHAPAFQGDDLIVFVHQAKGDQDRQQDTDGSDLDDDQGQFQLKKYQGPRKRQVGFHETVNILKKIDGQIDDNDRGQNNPEMR